MKKILGILVMMSFILCSMGGVMAVDTNQNVTVTIGESIMVLINPNPVTFGQVLPDTTDNPATSDDITLDATGSNVDVDIDVSVSGAPFLAGLKFDSVLANGEHYDLDCSGSPCGYSLVTIVPTLDVPIGYPAGFQSGVITYSITGPTP